MAAARNSIDAAKTEPDQSCEVVLAKNQIQKSEFSVGLSWVPPLLV